MVGTFDLTDNLLASAPRRVQIVGAPAQDILAGTLFGVSLIDPNANIPGGTALGITFYGPMIGFTATPSASRMDVLSVGFTFAGALLPNTVLMLLQTDDVVVGGGTSFVNSITGVAHPTASAITLQGTPADPDGIPGGYGTNVVRIRRIPVGALAANTPFRTSGDVLASFVPPASGARRILAVLHTFATGVTPATARVTWDIQVRIVP